MRTALKVLLLSGALALAGCGGTAVGGASDGDAARCLPGAEDCEDTTDDGAAGGTCLAGSEDCADDGAAGAPPALGMCAADAPDCNDMVVDHADGDGDAGDEFPSDQARADAQALLGVAEADLPAEVRVARRGTEMFALTEDYVLGRMTVDLDDDGSGAYRVVGVVVELPDGPESFGA